MASVATRLRSRTRQLVTSRLALFAHWSVHQKLNRVSSAQFNYIVLCYALKLTRLRVAVWQWIMWVVVAWRETVELVRSERSEVVQCKVDALTSSCRYHPRSVSAVTSRRHVTGSLA